jgi:hypothetical protein
VYLPFYPRQDVLRNDGKIDENSLKLVEEKLLWPKIDA